MSTGVVSIGRRAADVAASSASPCRSFPDTVDAVTPGCVGAPMAVLMPVAYLLLTPLGMFTLDTSSWETRGHGAVAKP